MKRVVVALSLMVLAFPAFAVKPCEELKAEIAAKIDAKGVKGYTLTIVSNEEAKGKEIVGTCDGGTKKIAYTR